MKYSKSHTIEKFPLIESVWKCHKNSIKWKKDKSHFKGDIFSKAISWWQSIWMTVENVETKRIHKISILCHLNVVYLLHRVRCFMCSSKMPRNFSLISMTNDKTVNANECSVNIFSIYNNIECQEKKSFILRGNT